jgi:hypothetical protein
MQLQRVFHASTLGADAPNKTAIDPNSAGAVFANCKSSGDRTEFLTKSLGWGNLLQRNAAIV